MRKLFYLILIVFMELLILSLAMSFIQDYILDEVCALFKSKV